MPVTVLRAGIIVGSGGISWEMTRQLVDHLPAMVTPRWVRTKTQPIAVADVVRYLVGVLDEPRAIGAGLRDRRTRGAAVRHHAAPGGRDQAPAAADRARSRCSAPALSSRWLALVTDVDTQTGRSLVDSMANEVVVSDDSITSLVAVRADGLRRGGPRRPG